MNITLTEYFHKIYLQGRELKTNSEYQCDRSCRVLVEWIGYDPPIHHVNGALLSIWIRAMEKTGRALTTIRRNRCDVMTVLRHAAEAGIGEWPTRVLQMATLRKAR